MLIVADLTFCSTGESSVHPWLAAHCTRIYRSSPRHCERAAGFLGAAKESVRTCAGGCTLLSESAPGSPVCFLVWKEETFGFHWGLWCQAVLFYLFSDGVSRASGWPLTSAFILSARLSGGFPFCCVWSWKPHGDTKSCCLLAMRQ